jgi:hypothetical protein
MSIKFTLPHLFVPSSHKPIAKVAVEPLGLEAQSGAPAVNPLMLAGLFIP